MTDFVDTSVLIDIQRGDKNALAWYSKQKTLGITSIVWLEVMAGASNKPKALKLGKFLSKFAMVYLTEDDQRWAMMQHTIYRLSHNIHYSDCLIAAVCYRLNVQLFTMNLKHFSPLLGILAYQPY